MDKFVFDLQKFGIKTIVDGNIFELTLQGGGGDLSSVTGVLPIVNGGTGQTVLSDVTVGYSDQACLDSAGNQISTSYLRKDISDTITGDLMIVGSESVNGNVTISGSESINGNVSISGDLYLNNMSGPTYLRTTDDILQITADKISLTSVYENQIWVNGVNVTALGGNEDSNIDLSTATVAAANQLSTARNVIANLASSVTGSFNGTANVTVGTTGTLPINKGGTGATTAVNARSNLGLGSIVLYNSPLPVANGGTAATTAAAARTNLGLGAVATQNTLAVANGGTGQTILTAVTVGKANSLTTARSIVASLGSTVAASFNGTANVTVGTQGVLPVAHGGTGATTAAAARTSLGALGSTITDTICLKDTSTVAGIGAAHITATRGNRSGNANTTILAPLLPTVSQANKDGYGIGVLLCGTHGLVLGGGDFYKDDYNTNVCTNCSDDIVMYSDTNVKISTNMQNDSTPFSSPSQIHTWEFNQDGNLICPTTGGRIIAYNVQWWGTCTTASATAAKVVTCADFRLSVGARIVVNFTNNNTAHQPTLNVNGTGAKPIVRGYSYTTANTDYQFGDYSATNGGISESPISGNYPVTFVYNGSCWVITSGTYATQNYHSGSKMHISDMIALRCYQFHAMNLTLYYGYCTTAASTAAKVIVCPELTEIPAKDFFIMIKFDATNSVNNATFNVNGTGAKPVYGVRNNRTANLIGAVGGTRATYRYDTEHQAYCLVHRSNCYGESNKSYYCTCSTAAGTVAKVNDDSTSIRTFLLSVGVLMTVNFTVANTAKNPTLNINRTGAKAIYSGGTQVTTTALKKGIYHMVYDGSAWQVLSVNEIA